MTDYDDTELDAALEALAHPDAPAGHMAHVLARTGPETELADAIGRARSVGRAGSPSRPSPLAWCLATAAAALVALGATWQVAPMPVLLPEVETARSDNGPYHWGGTPLDRPVLPPQAYWGMDPFLEFATLRPGTQEHRSAGRLAWLASTDGAVAAMPLASDLPAIDVDAIEPAPLDVPPVAPLDIIALAEIPLAPIVITPLVEEERP